MKLYLIKQIIGNIDLIRKPTRSKGWTQDGLTEEAGQIKDTSVQI